MLAGSFTAGRIRASRDPALVHWRLRENPFAAGFSSGFFYRSRAHEEALARLQLLVSDGDASFGMITGAVGNGKTFLALEFARALGEGSFAPLMASGADDLARLLVQATAVLRRSSPEANVPLNAALSRFRAELLDRCRPLGLHAVLIIDEAQMLGVDDLLGLRCLLNHVDGLTGLLTIVLVGTPELLQAVRELPPVRSRVRLGWQIAALDPDEVAPFLEHRLLAAGHPTGRVFAPEAIAALSENTPRTPRALNHAARLALLTAAMAGARMVGPDHVMPALCDCDWRVA